MKARSAELTPNSFIWAFIFTWHWPVSEMKSPCFRQSHGNSSGKQKRGDSGGIKRRAPAGWGGHWPLQGCSGLTGSLFQSFSSRGVPRNPLIFRLMAAVCALRSGCLIPSTSEAWVQILSGGGKNALFINLLIYNLFNLNSVWLSPPTSPRRCWAIKDT